MAEARKMRLVANERSFKVVSKSPIIMSAIVSQNAFIDVSRWTNTFDIDSICHQSKGSRITETGFQ